MDFQVFDHLLEGVQVISDDMRYIYLNDTVMEQGGIAGKQVIGMKCEDVYPGIEESSAFVNIRECIRTGEPINFMNKFDFPDGSHGYFELRMSRIEGGVLLFSVDRTVEMRREEQIRLANKRYETITESVRSALFEWDLNNQVVYGNAYFHELCTVNIGRKCLTLDDVLSIGGPHQKAEYNYFLQEALKHQHTNFNYHLESRMSSDEPFFAYQLNVVICYDDHGKPTNFLGYILDVTEERTNERLKYLKSQINKLFVSDIPLEKCLEEVLSLITSYTPDFRVAECWFPNYNAQEIDRRSVYSVIGLSSDPFVTMSDQFTTFKSNEGLPGICLDKNEVIWWNDLIKNKAFKRRKILKESMIKTGLAIPLEHRAKQVAVLTLFSEKNIDKSGIIIQHLEALKETIGNGIANKRKSHQRNILNDSDSTVVLNTAPDGTILKFNPTAAKMFVSRTEKRKSIFDLCVPNEVSHFKQKWNEFVHGPATYSSFKLNVLKVKSDRGTLKLNATKSTDDGSIFLIGVDISREDELFDLLSLSNRMAQIGFWSIDLKSKEMILSGNARKLLGLGENGIVNDFKMKFMKSLMPLELHSEMVTKLMNSPIDIDLNWSKKTEEGEKQYRLIARSEFMDKKCKRISAVIQDITSIVHTEHALERARGNYLELIDLSPIPIFLHDPKNLKIESANRKACEVYGYDKDEFHEMEMRSILHGHEQLVALERNSDVLEKGKEVYLGNFKHKTKTGVLLQVDNYARLIHFQDRDYILIIGVDRTESLALQQAISRAVIEAQEFQKEEISKELHDNICQLMVTSQLYLGLAKDDMTGNNEMYLSRALAMIEKANLETRQLSHALSTAKFTRQSFSESVKELIDNFHLTAKMKITTCFDQYLNRIELPQTVKVNLIRFLQEAISNSIKHSEATSIRISGEKSGNELILSVWDNGVGFDQEQMTPGIGIYNMQNRVQMCQGRMEIFSQPGNGTKLEISIPLEAAQNVLN